MNVETLKMIINNLPDDYEVRVKGKGSRLLPGYEVDLKDRTLILKTD